MTQGAGLFCLSMRRGEAAEMAVWLNARGQQHTTWSVDSPHGVDRWSVMITAISIHESCECWPPAVFTLTTRDALAWMSSERESRGYRGNRGPGPRFHKASSLQPRPCAPIIRGRRCIGFRARRPRFRRSKPWVEWLFVALEVKQWTIGLDERLSGGAHDEAGRILNCCAGCLGERETSGEAHSYCSRECASRAVCVQGVHSRMRPSAMISVR